MQLYSSLPHPLCDQASPQSSARPAAVLGRGHPERTLFVRRRPRPGRDCGRRGRAPGTSPPRRDSGLVSPAAERPESAIREASASISEIRNFSGDSWGGNRVRTAGERGHWTADSSAVTAGEGTRSGQQERGTGQQTAQR